MRKTCTALITTLLLLFFLSAVNGMAQANGKQQNSPPFLITGKMPHLTKLLIQHWDNTELHLSDTQKSKLLVIRKETIEGVQKLSKEIAVLESQIAEGSLSGKAPEELGSMVQAVAKLKTEATMIHLRCIYNTRRILDQQQSDFLNKL